MDAPADSGRALLPSATDSAEKKKIRAAGAGADDGVDGSSPRSSAVRAELRAILSLSWPVALATFCRVGMYSTDTAFGASVASSC